MKSIIKNICVNMKEITKINNEKENEETRDTEENEETRDTEENETKHIKGGLINFNGCIILYTAFYKHMINKIKSIFESKFIKCLDISNIIVNKIEEYSTNFVYELGDIEKSDIYFITPDYIKPKFINPLFTNIISQFKHIYYPFNSVSINNIFKPIPDINNAIISFINFYDVDCNKITELRNFNEDVKKFILKQYSFLNLSEAYILETSNNLLCNIIQYPHDLRENIKQLFNNPKSETNGATIKRFDICEKNIEYKITDEITRNLKKTA